ncbi:MAG: GIY-YIG nuclease family protein [Patescibacteria group bacterium]
MFYTYVLESIRNGRRYVGSTDNLKRRFTEHNTGLGGKYTSDNRPLRLIYYEAYINKHDAVTAEKFYKSGYGREVLKGKLDNYLKNI